MRIIIITQNDYVYLPKSVAALCETFQSEISCIVTAPPMSTFRGPIQGLKKHFFLFGFKGFLRLGLKAFGSRVMSFCFIPKSSGPFYSVKSAAKAFRLPCYSVHNLKGRQFKSILDKYLPDLMVSLSCPQIIEKEIRDRFPLGCINVHGAPLPRYRGLMPAFWVLRNGEEETAVTVHELDAKLDDGDIFHQEKIKIDEAETWDSLVTKTKAAGANALIKVIKQVKRGRLSRKKNNESEATYYSFPTVLDRRAFLRAGRRFF